MATKKIKLIIVDLFGVMTLGNWHNICKDLAKKYHRPEPEVYRILYHKYFNQAALGKLTLKQFWEKTLRELGFQEDWKRLDKKHLSYQILNRAAFAYFKSLRKQGCQVILLSKNIPPHFNYAVKKYKLDKNFDAVINTYDLGLPKASPKTIRLVLRRFKAKPEEAIMTDDQDFNLTEPAKLGVSTVLFKNNQQAKKEINKLL